MNVSFVSIVSFANQKILFCDLKSLRAHTQTISLQPLRAPHMSACTRASLRSSIKNYRTFHHEKRGSDGNGNRQSELDSKQKRLTPRLCIIVQLTSSLPTVHTMCGLHQRWEYDLRENGMNAYSISRRAVQNALKYLVLQTIPTLGH